MISSLSDMLQDTLSCCRFTNGSVASIVSVGLKRTVEKIGTQQVHESTVYQAGRSSAVFSIRPDFTLYTGACGRLRRPVQKFAGSLSFKFANPEKAISFQSVNVSTWLS